MRENFLINLVFKFIKRPISISKYVFQKIRLYNFPVKLRNLLNKVLVLILNEIMIKTRKDIYYSNSVLHISYMVHIPYYMTQTLRRHGIKADYLAVRSESPWWGKCDYVYPKIGSGQTGIWNEWKFFWSVVSKYEVIHSHFAIMFTETGWELPILKKLGRKLIIHYRGCEARDQKTNMMLHPEINICQKCDYNGDICKKGVSRVKLAEKFGDRFLVTTPDMRDFKPNAEHFPFFLPEIEINQNIKRKVDNERVKVFKIVHITNHPGIEGTDEIIEVIEKLKNKGFNIDFKFFKGIVPNDALIALQEADLSIGKMKMGYYANTQIESMYLGIPAVTYVRPEFMTTELEQSGFIFSSLSNLESTLEYYILNPIELFKKKQIARSSIINLHNENKLIDSLLKIYDLNKVYDNPLKLNEEKENLPKILFIGNIANNAYYNAKFLREKGYQVDVMCPDDFWVMSSPEWEEADFEGEIQNHFFPNWDKIDLKGYQRPKWFSQGSFKTSVEYLLAYRSGNHKKANQLWKKMESERKSKSKILNFRLLKFFILEKIEFLNNLIFPQNQESQQFNSPEKGIYQRSRELTSLYNKIFENRKDKLETYELLDLQHQIEIIKPLLRYYEIVQGYAVDPRLPMLANFKPYCAFEHGTLRDDQNSSWNYKGPFYPNSIGRVTALSYALADHVFITNEDCISSSLKLGIKNYTIIPHPLDDVNCFYPSERYRKKFREDLDTEIILFCPIRHDWYDKGVDQYINALPGLKKVIHKKFKVIFLKWGKQVNDSKILIDKLGVSDLVVWLNPMGRIQLAKWLTSADVVYDQLKYNAFSGITPRSIACGTPVLTAYDPKTSGNIFKDPPPVLFVKELKDISNKTLKALDPAYKNKFSSLARIWIKQNHSKEIVTEKLIAAYESIL